MEPGKSTSSLEDSIRAAAVREQLDRILSDSAFSGATRRSRLLRYLVEQALEDCSEGLKESVIATEVFERAPDYDPQVDSVVRVEVGRLRARLGEYYAKPGTREPVRIEIPKGGYRPIFVFRETAAAPLLERAPVRPRRRHWKPVAAGAFAIAAILASFALWRARTSVPATAATIAVMPFLNLSGNAADDYLGDGISEELTEALAEFNDLRVVARTSSFQYKGKTADVREVGRNLRAGAVMEGSVARRGGQIHVVAQLILASNGYHLWSHSYDATLADLPEVEIGIARAVREKLSPAWLLASAKDVASTRSPEAHDLYLRAAFELNQRSEPSIRRALELARQATEKDPSFAQPYVLMAAAESQLNTLLAQAPHAGAERASAHIAKALALDPANSAARAQKALLTYTDQWDWPRAEREFRLALAGGSHASAENLYGWSLMSRGRFAEARKHLQLAAELDPLSLGPQLNQVSELMDERDYPAAMRKADQILQTAPSNFAALYLATSISYWQSDCPGTKARGRKLLDSYPKAHSALVMAAAADQLCGHPAEAATAFAALMREPPSGYVSPYSVAAVSAMRKDPEQAMSFLQKSAELREPVLMLLKVDRAFDPVRGDPRFIALERRLGLLD